MSELFNVNVPAISKHLKNIFDSGELDEDSVVSIFETTAADGKNYKTKYFNLDAIIAVGYRVNSKRATQIQNLGDQYCPRIHYQGKGVYVLLIAEGRLDMLFASTEKITELNKT